ncbi:expressed unknown protein [Ectocarpus siliculosus]|uniref:Uncharacterized protein n=1 Tax=Ectocarpus siliculosus TaxID=2880 RepID=D8LSV0_ECTSI|nr:expressed unknown protein [Ectocarpus siliculosus]|eukprot:CBN77877.1 expressed unknown protein [Ectocarpus siliculosus]
MLRCKQTLTETESSARPDVIPTEEISTRWSRVATHQERGGRGMASGGSRLLVVDLPKMAARYARVCQRRLVRFGL